MTKKEIIEFLKTHPQDEILERATYDACAVPEGEFTIVGGIVYLKEKGEMIEIGSYSSYVGGIKTFKDRVFIEKK